jgi:hypothetical protein
MKRYDSFERNANTKVLTADAREKIETLAQSTNKDIASKASKLLTADDELKTAQHKLTFERNKFRDNPDALAALNNSLNEARQWGMFTVLMAPIVTYTTYNISRPFVNARDNARTAENRSLEAEKSLGQALLENKDNLTEEEKEVYSYYSKSDYDDDNELTPTRRSFTNRSQDSNDYDSNKSDSNEFNPHAASHSNKNRG